MTLSPRGPWVITITGAFYAHGIAKSNPKVTLCGLRLKYYGWHVATGQAVPTCPTCRDQFPLAVEEATRGDIGDD